MIMDTLNCNFDLAPQPEAYIITIKGHQKSEQEAMRCAKSCDSVGQKWHVWQAFSVEDDKIIYPDHAKDQDHYRFLKKTNSHLTPNETAAALSHYSLWAHCTKIDRPIIIFEHDAVMCQKYEQHKGFNEICYLGCYEQYKKGMWPTPPTYSLQGKNYIFINKAHAYAIDPGVARQLVSHVIKFGIVAPADMIIRSDLFHIDQRGLYAYELEDGSTTITNRKMHGPDWLKHANEHMKQYL